jgi:hypothetical protein
MDIIEIFDITIKDYDMLINNKHIREDKYNKIIWIDNNYDGKFNDIMSLCKNGEVVRIKKTGKVQLLAWNFNIESFQCFKEVFIMTYIFEASMMKYYFDMYNISYKKYSIENYEIVLFENKKPYNKQQYKDLINIYEGNLNNIGDRKTALSLNWLRKNTDLRKKLKNDIYNYLQNKINSKSEDIIWTTFKSMKKYLQGKGYTKSFVSCNARATNKFNNCNTIVYCCNRFISPDYIKYFEEFEISIDEEMFALAEMLQFIWRSCIRNHKPINVYIPSKRMRDLLYMWLNNENL